MQPGEPGLVMPPYGTIRAVTVSFLLSAREDPAVHAPGRGSHTLQPACTPGASCGVLMLDRPTAFFVPTLDPARGPPAVRCDITPCAAGDRLCGGWLHGPPRQTVTICGDRCRHIVTAGRGRGRRTPPVVSSILHSRTGLVVGTEIVELVWVGKAGGDAQGSQRGGKICSNIL